MEKYFGEKQERFSFRKLSVGLVSATISSLFFMSVLASSSVDAQETAGVHYKYVADSELSSEEKKQLVYDIPTYVENDDETYSIGCGNGKWCLSFSPCFRKSSFAKLQYGL
ncbi:TPA: YSIRK-type signal peptide-containing protein [Streptococcus pneumoniae]